MPLSSRERVLSVLHHEQPDRVPIVLGVSNATGIKMKPYQGIKTIIGVDAPDDYIYDWPELGTALIDEETMQRLHSDVRGVLDLEPETVRDRNRARDPHSDYIDSWGTGQSEIKPGEWFPNVHPLQSANTLDDIEAYGEDRLPVGVRQVSLPIDSDAATDLSNQATAALKTGDFSKIPVELNPAIHRLLVHDGKLQYAALLREIADPANRPLVFHCSHGVHRTGTGAAILLSALGVPWEAVREDYLLSNKYRHDEVQKRLGQLRIMAASKKGIPEEQVDMSNMEGFLIQHGSYIDASYDEMVEEYGAVDSYVRDGLGLSEEEIQRLQDELLE